MVYQSVSVRLFQRSYFILFFLLVLSSCEKKEPKERPKKTPASQLSTKNADAGPSKNSKLKEENLVAVVPNSPGEFHPSMAKLAGSYDREIHLQTQKCGECHQEILSEWQTSVHALASLNNPYYKVSFDAFVKDSGQEKTTFCGGCHDPVLMFSQTIKKEVKADDPASFAGVNCMTCHGISEATTEGNASYSLKTLPIIYPDKKGRGLDLHKQRMLIEKSDGFCASCHVGFFTPQSGHGAVLPGLNEYAPWRGSGYNKNPTTRVDEIGARDCVSCHMPKIVNSLTKKSYASHRFAGGHSTLAAAIGSKAQLDAVRKMVQSAATIEIAAVGKGEVKLQSLGELKKGDRFWIDVVVFNKNTGHHFPGGAQDLRDTWIELEIFDAKQRRLASAGLDHEKSMNDPSALRLRATMASPKGEIVKGHQVAQFRTSIFNRTIAPRDTRVARFQWTLNEAPSFPLKIKTRLRHRRLDRSLFDAACTESKSARGKEYIKGTKKYNSLTMDPCRPQPVIEIDEDQLVVASSYSPAMDWKSHYHRGLGLLKQVQEGLEEAEDALLFARKAASKAEKIDRARIEFILAKVLSRQGRSEAAMDAFDACEKLMGEHTAIDFARGLTQQRTFHNDEAVKWFKKAAAKTSDDRIFRQLAISQGSIMHADEALKASQSGLAIEPRDPHLLRSQMLALRKKDKKQAKIAFDAFSTYKRDESEGKIRKKCIGDSEECRIARQPIPVIPMRLER